MTHDRLQVLEELGGEFERVARTAPTRRRWRRPGALLALVLVSGGTATALAAGGLLDGKPVADPPGVVAEPDAGTGVLRPGTARLTTLRVPDPAGGPPWGLRTLRTTREQGCVQIGRVVGGRLGVLGQDGSFGNDGRFHELPASSAERRDCRTLDAAGQMFLAVSYQGLPASGLGSGCRVQPDEPRLPTGAPRPRQTVPPCPREDLRIVYYGTLGPRATAVTYLDGDRVRTARPAGPDGAYLVVTRPSARRPAKGYFVPTSSPGSGLRSVRYRDGSECRIRSPRSLGGAKLCPRVGYVAPKVVPVTAAQVRAPVTATFGPRPERPEGPAAGEPAWKLTVRFRARRASDARAFYVVTVAPDDARRCRSGTSIGPVARTLPAGAPVSSTTYVPARCRGTVRGTVSFHQAGEDDEFFFVGDPRRDPVVGRYEVEIP